jgi:WbqC-like protein family
MRIGIMQPYIFPYIGYFQLINAVDRFVVYDDVNFIKQGWINRNRILLNKKDFLFSVPVKDISSFKTIKESLIDTAKYSIWVTKFLSTLTQAYKKAKHYNAAYSHIRQILEQEYSNISELATASLTGVCAYAGVDREWTLTSSGYGNENLKAQDRVIDICKKEQGTEYFNAAGGQELYCREDFQKHGIVLKFIKPRSFQYAQLNNDFIPGLSIIDVMMFNSVDEINYLINQYELI